MCYYTASTTAIIGLRALHAAKRMIFTLFGVFRIGYSAPVRPICTKLKTKAYNVQTHRRLRLFNHKTQQHELTTTTRQKPAPNTQRMHHFTCIMSTPIIHLTSRQSSAKLRRALQPAGRQVCSSSERARTQTTLTKTPDERLYIVNDDCDVFTVTACIRFTARRRRRGSLRQSIARDKVGELRTMHATHRPADRYGSLTHSTRPLQKLSHVDDKSPRMREVSAPSQ